MTTKFSCQVVHLPMKTENGKHTFDAFSNISREKFQKFQH